MDATQFYVLPIPVLIGLLVFLLGLSTILTILIRRSLVEPEDDIEGVSIPLFDNTGGNSSATADHDITIAK
jgi:hypothetical protein